MSFAHHRRRIIALGLAGALAIGAVGAVYAQDANNNHAANTAAGNQRLVKNALKNVAQIAGLSPETIRQGLKDGKSLNQILTENGKDPATVQAAVLDAIKTKLGEAVTNGRLNEQQAADALARATEAIPNLFERVPDGSHAHRHPRLVHAIKGMMKTAADTIGVTVKDLAQEVHGGKTVGQVATEHGSSPEAVIAAVTADANARIDKAVADGKLKPEQAAKLKVAVAERVTKFVNEGGPKHRQANGGQ